MGGHNIKENGSGKYDPTAYNAIRNVSMDEQAEEEKFKKLLGTIFNLCELSGFHLEEFGGNKYGMVIYNLFYDCWLRYWKYRRIYMCWIICHSRSDCF